MPSKILTLLLSLAAQSGVYARPTGPRAIAEISTALVLLDAPSRAWAFVKYSPGSDKTVQVPATTPTLDGRVVCPVVQSLP